MEKIYKTNQELIELLFHLGFIETSEEYVPSHYEKMQREGYDPDVIKRYFKNEVTGVVVYFDYTKICIQPRSCVVEFSDYKISESELMHYISKPEYRDKTGTKFITK